MGLSFFYHDSAACLVRDGQVIAAVQEERFTREKHDAGFPVQSIQYCLQFANISIEQIDVIVFYEKPFLKFDRILHSHFQNWPHSYKNFLGMTKEWLGGKLRIPSQIRKKTGFKGPILFCKHHESHAASAFYSSPFSEAAIVTLDGVGEWATAAIHRGTGTTLETLEEIHYPHSLGLFYSAFTAYLGFRVNEDEYKVMGLAPYGKPAYVEQLQKVLTIHSDGTFSLDEKYFSYDYSERMMNDTQIFKLLGFPGREPNSKLESVHYDLAASVQQVLEVAVLSYCQRAVRLTGQKNLALAGGVALNCTANSKLLNSGLITQLHIFPASGDAGSAVGAALRGYYLLSKNPRTFKEFETIYLGPEYSNEEIKNYVERANLPYKQFSDSALYGEVAKLLAEQKVVGWFQGRLEFGPRALGNRSILADPTHKENWPRVNQKIKFREDFRPLAPSVTEESFANLFESRQSSPYMLLTAENRTDRLPAVTHVDGSSRVQTVSQEQNAKYHRLLTEFEKLSGLPVLLNTSFNVSNMPIVCTPQNAFQCFAESDLDILVLGNFVIRRDEIAYLPRKNI